MTVTYCNANVYRNGLFDDWDWVPCTAVYLSTAGIYLKLIETGKAKKTT
jgi:hypothetical protein